MSIFPPYREEKKIDIIGRYSGAHGAAERAGGLLRLTRQVGPCVFTDLAPKLVSVHGDLDQPDIVAAIRGARGEWDKGLRHYVIEVRFVRRLEDELGTIIDPLFRTG